MSIKYWIRSRILTGVLYTLVLCGCNRPVFFNKRAAEGHGLLPRPVKMEGVIETTNSKYAFDGGTTKSSSRILFETADDPNFVIRVRDVSVPPGKDPVPLSLPVTAALEMRTDRGRLRLGVKDREWRQGTTIMVPAGLSIQLMNPTDRELIVRLYLVEAK